MDLQPLLARFMNEFSFMIASDDRQKRRVYRLRHDIYCAELIYEPPSDPVNKLEYDGYDDRAIHCLIEHRRTGVTAACTRIVLPLPDAKPPFDRLPMESYGGRSLTHPELHPQRLPPADYYEISRLAVARAFRTRLHGKEVPGICDTPLKFTDKERETFSMLVSGLFISGYALGRRLDKSIAFAMMEPRLPRLLSMSGFHFTKVGDAIDFHGRRSAYCITREQAEAGMNRQLIPLYEHIRDQLEAQLISSDDQTHRVAMNL
ncbi:PEP-CTERM/exosortase system-associated acyltransferase [Halomonas sp.]|uniref:PEP-CTERM/exosortase system-associated acyltransferase n=1 Tax=Halomonas sp. TaxID=1486246 RepID=UPI002603A64F|nr:PEP-CTERM/exosortase system-associated acyltransferase [Halomonas sp.]